MYFFRFQAKTRAHPSWDVQTPIENRCHCRPSPAWPPLAVNPSSPLTCSV